MPGVKLLTSLTWSPNACLPMVMGCVQPGTSLGMFLQMIGSRKTVPPRMFLMVPLGLFHIFFSLNSKHLFWEKCAQTSAHAVMKSVMRKQESRACSLPSTLASSGVMVAHLTATLYFFVARAESMVTWSSVWSRYGRPRSKYFSSTSTLVRMS